MTDLELRLDRWRFFGFGFVFVLASINAVLLYLGHRPTWLIVFHLVVATLHLWRALLCRCVWFWTGLIVRSFLGRE